MSNDTERKSIIYGKLEFFLIFGFSLIFIWLENLYAKRTIIVILNLIIIAIAVYFSRNAYKHRTRAVPYMMANAVRWFALVSIFLLNQCMIPSNQGKIWRLLFVMILIIEFLIVLLIEFRKWDQTLQVWTKIHKINLDKGIFNLLASFTLPKRGLARIPKSMKPVLFFIAFTVKIAARYLTKLGSPEIVISISTFILGLVFTIFFGKVTGWTIKLIQLQRDRQIVLYTEYHNIYQNQ